MKTPDCERVQLYLDGRLAEAEKAAFEAHLATCIDCQPVVASWQGFAARFTEQTAPLLAPPTAVEEQRFAARVRSSAPAPRVSWTWAFAGLGAVAALVIAFVWWSRVPVQVAPLPEQLAVTGASGDVIESTGIVSIGEDRVGVSAKSRVRIERHDRQKVKLQLERGSVAARVKHREPGQSFVVASGPFEVTVVGTQFRVTKLNEGLRVEVAEGHVRVSAAEKTYDVLRGQSLELDAAGARPGGFAETELAEFAPPAPAVETVDAGEPEAAEEEEEPSRPSQKVSAATVQQWRRAALDGKCGALLPVLKQSAQQHPRQAEVWSALADCQRLLGNDREAATAYRHVVSVAGSEDGDRSRMLLASLLLEKLNDAPGAAEVLRGYLKHKQVPALEAAARMKLAKALLAQGKKAQARAELQRVVKALPDSAPALEALELLKRLGQ